MIWKRHLFKMLQALMILVRCYMLEMLAQIWGWRFEGHQFQLWYTTFPGFVCSWNVYVGIADKSLWRRYNIISLYIYIHIIIILSLFQESPEIMQCSAGLLQVQTKKWRGWSSAWAWSFWVWVVTWHSRETCSWWYQEDFRTCWYDTRRPSNNQPLAKFHETRYTDSP